MYKPFCVHIIILKDVLLEGVNTKTESILFKI